MRHTSSVLAAVLVLALTVVGAAGPFFNMAKQMTAPDAAPDGREIAQTIWFQGYLADKVTGDPIEGEHTVEITILDAEVLGNEIWGPEAHDETIFSAGWFSVEMGIDEPLPAFENPPYYLEISVDSEIFDPRIRIASVPFAFHANSSELDDADWAVVGNHLYPATAETVSIGSTNPRAPLYVETMGSGPGLGIHTPNEEGEAAIYLSAGEDMNDMMIIDKIGSGMGPERDVSVVGKGVILTGPGASGLLMGAMSGPIDFIVGGFGEPDRQYQAMHISEEGYVGVGTPLPDTTLHVMGTTKTLGFQMPTGAADGYVLKSDENGFGTWQEGGESDGDWTVDGATMYPATAETVVIGGTAGWSPLTVWGDGFFPNAYFSTPTAMGSASILLAAGDDVPSGLVIGHTGETPEKGERQFGDAGKGFMVSGPAATGLQIMSENGPIDFHVDTSGPARQDHAMTITEAGDVGIGTTMPDARLQVTEEGHMGVTVNSSDDWGTATALIQAGTGLNDYLRFQHFGPTASGTMNGVPLAGKGVVQAGTGSDGLVLSAGSGDSMYVMIGSSEVMRLTSDGEVGIGTATPDTTLHVSGGIKADAFQLPTGASDGHVLTSDASGNASWQAPTSGSSGILIDVHREGATTAIGTSWTQYDDAQVTIEAPESGYVLVTSSVHCILSHTNGTDDELMVGHTSNLGVGPSQYNLIANEIPSSAPSAAAVEVGFTVSSTHEVVTAGTYTYYLMGMMNAGQDPGDIFWYAETRAVFYPYEIILRPDETMEERREIERKRALLGQ